MSFDASFRPAAFAVTCCLSALGLFGCAAPISDTGSDPSEESTGESSQASTDAPDFDGDGITDTYAVTTTGISITRGSSHASHFYPFTGSFFVNTVADTDGVAGDELVVVHSGGISVIRDRNHSSYNYVFTGDFMINKVTDTDGVKGAEIVVVHLGGITVLRDRNQSGKLYNFNTSFAINTTADTDAKPGDEIVVVVPNAIVIITDRTQTSQLNQYLQPFTIEAVTDTDGKPGKDIVLHIFSGLPRGISILHPVTGLAAFYGFEGNFLEVTDVSNKDGLPGAEVTVHYQTAKHALITDRTGTIQQL